MRWLEVLGPLKWPSLLLVAAPLVAYPFWLPKLPPAKFCGQVTVEEQTFMMYRLGSGSFILRPAHTAGDQALPIKLAQPVGFDAGGMVIDEAVLKGANLTCPPN